jgi:hypothetical protein
MKQKNNKVKKHSLPLNESLKQKQKIQCKINEYILQKGITICVATRNLKSNTAKHTYKYEKDFVMFGSRRDEVNVTLSPTNSNDLEMKNCFPAGLGMFYTKPCYSALKVTNHYQTKSL